MSNATNLQLPCICLTKIWTFKNKMSCLKFMDMSHIMILLNVVWFYLQIACKLLQTIRMQLICN
jgi:hypothetical protein